LNCRLLLKAVWDIPHPSYFLLHYHTYKVGDVKRIIEKCILSLTIAVS
jgi:hypothetical protein